MNQEDKTISTFRRDANNVRLSVAEKEDIKNHIIFSPYLFHSTFFTYKNLVAIAAIIALIISGGGTSFAAASSLPGDALYGVKINVNEEVKSLIAIGPDAKTKVEANRVKERLNEAEELSAKGKLTTRNQAIIKQNIKKHTTTLKQNVAILASEKKTEEATHVIDDLKNSLDQHEAALHDISNAGITKKAMATSTGEISSESDHIDDIINTVMETKAEINTLKDALDDSSKSDTDTSTSTSTSTPSNIINVNATSTATTSTKANIDIHASSSMEIEIRRFKK